MFCRRNVLLLLFSLSAAFGARAQVGQSPYTVRGIGNLNGLATARNAGMGGVGIGNTNQRFISLQNPALLAYDVYLTSILAGFSVESRRLATTEQQDRIGSGGFDYLAISFPIYSKKQDRGIGFAIGLAPYSTVSYRLQTTEPVQGAPENEMNFLYEGSGGLTQAYASTGISLFKGLSAGFKVSYLFGSISEELSSGLSSTGMINSPSYTARFLERTSYSDLLFTGALAYRKYLDKTKGTYVMAGFTYDQQKDLSPDRTFITERNQVSGGGSMVVRDTLANHSASFTLPAAMGMGVSYGKNFSYMVGADLRMQDWSGNKGVEYGTEEGLGNSYRLSVGGEWIPSYLSRNYFSRMAYRTGVQYEKTPFLINGEEINEFGINFGVTFPVGVSGVHTSFSWGQRGTTDNNLLRERFFRIGLGVSLNERWFERYRYD